MKSDTENRFSLMDKFSLIIFLAFALIGLYIIFKFGFGEIKKVNITGTTTQSNIVTIEPNKNIIETRLTGNVIRYIDKELGVVCYVIENNSRTGIACIPIGSNLIEPFYSNSMSLIDPNKEIIN